MARYTGQISKSVTSTTVGVAALSVSSTQGRIQITEFVLGSDAATLGTSNWRFELNRSTALPTGTTITVRNMDPSDVSSLVSLLQSNLSANGTLTSGDIVMTVPLNQQATFRWIAAPGGEIIIPATTNTGIHLMTPVCGNTPSCAGQLWWNA